jgi:catechol 2,3-dioxygenase-like lactoylglutathione lyase family enzyme
MGPDFVALQVRDLEASGQVYEERLGLKRASEGLPSTVVFRTEPIPFAEGVDFSLSLRFRPCREANRHGGDGTEDSQDLAE